VGGSYGDSRTLLVRVAARAVDGRATEAALRALAGAFAVGLPSVRLVSGPRARTKIVEVAGDEEVLARRLSELLEGGA